MIESIGLELFLIVVLILLNGFFAGSEIAVVSSRRSRIDEMAQAGKKRAAVLAQWLREPEVFLATVQIGVSFVGALASAVGGAAAFEYLKPRLEQIPWIAEWAEISSIVLVVLPITYLSLVVGELVPKSLALIYRERMALQVSMPIHWLSRAARPLVSLLTLSTRAALFLFGQRQIPKELFVSEEEIRFLIKEGASQGVFDQTEQQMIPKVFDFSELRIRDLMVPREQITALDINTPREKLMTIVTEEGFTRLPVFKGTIDQIVGILHMKDLIHMITHGQIIILQDIIRKPVFIPENSLAKDLLRLFQRQHLHLAIVQDAGARTVGLVTLEDLIERIVGDIRDEHDIA